MLLSKSFDVLFLGVVPESVALDEVVWALVVFLVVIFVDVLLGLGLRAEHGVDGPLGARSCLP